jgi:hypothetical protein
MGTPSLSGHHVLLIKEIIYQIIKRKNITHIMKGVNM